MDLLNSKEAQGPKKEKHLSKGLFTLLVEGKPSTFVDATSSLDASFWKEVINSEFNSIIQN